MDATLVYLAVGFVLSALYFEWRSRRLLKNIAPVALQRVQDAFFDSEVSKDEDGTERVLLRPNKRTKAFVSALVPALIPPAIEWAKKNVKLDFGGGGLPAGLDMSQIGQALPQLIMAMPGKNVNLAGFKVPKEIVAGFSGLVSAFVGKAQGKPGESKKSVYIEEPIRR